MNSLKQQLKALGIAVAGFALTFGILKWEFLISALISIGLFAGVYLLATPVLKIGDMELERLQNGLELKEIFDTSVSRVKALEMAAKNITDLTIQEKAVKLSSTAQDIIHYLESNPSDISPSRHFLDYYLQTGLKILNNYETMEEAHLSPKKAQLITDQTSESLDLLNRIYANQRDGYHVDKMMDLAVETELLEKTLQLGGGLDDEK